MTNKVLITGAEGFTAHYLIGFLSQSRKHKLFFTDLANNLNYDQLLLEYKNTGTGNPWIHISFKVDSQRRQVLTLFNDKTFSQGLSHLA